jgi:antitoxin VapB
MTTAKIFKNGRSQAVRLPKEFRFDCDEVCIARHGNIVILYPKGKGWDVMERVIGQFSDDFMADRDQPEKAEERNWK